MEFSSYAPSAAIDRWHNCWHCNGRIPVSRNVASVHLVSEVADVTKAEYGEVDVEMGKKQGGILNSE